jgi:hypothetical protein
MGVPKGYRTNLKIVDTKIGPDRRQEILDDISYKGTFLPKSVSIEDMDKEFIDFVGKDTGFGITIDGKKLPVIFLTIQRWSEFTRTWQFTDEFKNIELPFITIVRKPDIQQGQNQAGLWNIPGKRTYTYMKVPTYDGIRDGIDLYKIPQPTPVDITYEVRLFSNRMKDLNKFNNILQRAFQSRQCYINVNGHPMPLLLENIGDESNIDDFEKRRFYIQSFEIKLMGYIMDEEDYEIIPTINRVLTTMEVDENRLLNEVVFEPVKRGNDVIYTFVFKPKSNTQFTFTALYTTAFTLLTDIENITRITITINSVVVFDGNVLVSPLTINANDVVNIKVSKSFYAQGKFILAGSTI